jgi:hypothetical protein
VTSITAIFKNPCHSHFSKKRVQSEPPNTFISYLTRFCTNLLDSWCVHVP